MVEVEPKFSHKLGQYVYKAPKNIYYIRIIDDKHHYSLFYRYIGGMQ